MVEGVDPLLTNAELKRAINAYAYEDTATINKYGRIENWDVSRVTSLSQTFRSKSSFNADISKWNVSSVIDMGGSKF